MGKVPVVEMHAEMPGAVPGAGKSMCSADDVIHVTRDCTVNVERVSCADCLVLVLAHAHSVMGVALARLLK